MPVVFCYVFKSALARGVTVRYCAVHFLIWSLRILNFFIASHLRQKFCLQMCGIMNNIGENRIVVTLNKRGSALSKKWTWCHRWHVIIVRDVSCEHVCVAIINSTQIHACPMLISMHRRITKGFSVNWIDAFCVHGHIVSEFHRIAVRSSL